MSNEVTVIAYFTLVTVVVNSPDGDFVTNTSIIACTIANISYLKFCYTQLPRTTTR